MSRAALPFARRLHAPAGTWLGAACLLASGIAGPLLAPRTFAAAWIAAWWCMAGLVLGGCSVVWLHALTGGRWGEVLRPAAARLAMRRAWLLPLAVPLLFVVPLIYPWAIGDGSAAFDGLHEPAFARAWFGGPAVALRALVYLLAGAWLSSGVMRPGLGGRRAALSFLLWSVMGSLASADLLMSLVPGWRSTGFGLLVLSGQTLGGAALLVWWCARHRPAQLAHAPEGAPPLGRDLGNLLLMLVMLWGYLGFMQFLVIWAENLPAEIAWFVPRLQTGWWYAGAALVALQLVVPMAALVLRAVKDRPASLGAVALLVLAAHGLDALWLVLPSVTPHARSSWWLGPLCLLGMGLLLFSPMLQQGGAAAETIHA
ncbi:MAG: hypothetical protein J7549_00725 [Variovorax sp.]|nr:hypothetical protein [Variovorax sp.]